MAGLLPQEGPLNILSIDGGGIRGVYSAYLLQRIHEEYGVDFAERFDLIAGTSTGSIIAAGLATGIPIADIVGLYENHGDTIFYRPWWSTDWLHSAQKLFSSSYDNATLKSILDEKFTCKRLSDARTGLVIPATNIGDGVVHVQKSSYDSSFVRDPTTKIADAVLASCSAPTYFNPHKIGPYMLADGGLWANNPTLVAIIDAKRRLGAELDDLHVLPLAQAPKSFATLRSGPSGGGCPNMALCGGDTKKPSTCC